MKEITILPNITIREAMKALDKTAEKCLLVIDESHKLLGTLTDGDLRRRILSGGKFSEDISSIYCKSPKVLIKGSNNEEEAKSLLRDFRLNLIPVIDENNSLVDFVTWANLSGENLQDDSLKNVSVVVMAGGKGTRMEPFTKILPKPLIPIKEKTVIEHIIERFTDVNCNEFFLSVNYKGKILKAYFDELEPAYNIKFVEEKEPLGTAGSLSLLREKINQPFFVTNCDIIVKADYTSIYDFHLKGDYDITLVASAKDYIIPYGTCELNNDGHLSYINEKPTYDFLINTGLYVLNPSVLEFIPEQKFYHITHLIKDLIDKGKRVGVYPINDDAWIDVGQWSEYKKAEEIF